MMHIDEADDPTGCVDGFGSRDERVAGDEHLVAWLHAGRDERELQRVGAVARPMACAAPQWAAKAVSKASTSSPGRPPFSGPLAVRAGG